MNGIIYCIINKKNNKKYVGQTQTALKKRYPLNWWKYTHNPYLKHSVEKYGINNFEFEILQSGIPTIDELNDAERFYANKLNTYSPIGYNLKECGGGKKIHEETRKKLSDSISKPRTFKNASTGEIITVSKLRVFCEEMGISVSAMNNLLCGISDYCSDFIRVDADQSKIKKAQVYEFLSPQDEVVRGTVSNVCARFGLDKHTLYHLINGQCKTSKQWRFIGKVI